MAPFLSLLLSSVLSAVPPACILSFSHTTKHFLSLCFSIFHLAHDPPALSLSRSVSLRRSSSTGSGTEWVHAAARWDQLSLWAAERHRKPAKGNNRAEKQWWRSHQAVSSCRGNQEFDPIIRTRSFTKGCQYFLCAQTLVLFSLKFRIAFLFTCRRRSSRWKRSVHSMILVPCWLCCRCADFSKHVWSYRLMNPVVLLSVCLFEKVRAKCKHNHTTGVRNDLTC